MESAALVLLASGMGVLFGWQPMSDGSERYEYIVQLEPELAARLDAGQAIPISSDVPDEIRPIGRIRIVVGRQSLPRQRLTTQLKPSDENAQFRNGVIETQYTVPPVEPSNRGRYGASNSQQILPPGGAEDYADQPFARSLPNNSPRSGNAPSEILPPQGAQGVADAIEDASQALGNQLRNIGDSVRTDTQQLFGSANSRTASNPLNQANDAVDRMHQGLQEGVRRTQEQLQNTVENVGQRTRAAVDQFGQPIRQSLNLNSENQAGQGSSTERSILPPGRGQPPQQADPRMGQQRQRLDQPVDSALSDDWQSPQQHNAQANDQNSALPPTQRNALDQPTTTNPETFNAPWPPRPREENQSQGTSNAPPPLMANNNSSDSQVGQDRYGSTGAGANSTLGEGRRSSDADVRSTGPNFPLGNSSQTPSLTDEASNSLLPSSDAMHTRWPTSVPATPEIRRDMLDQPATAQLQAANGEPVGSTPPANQPTTTGQPQASDLGWDTKSLTAAKPSQPNDDNRALFPLLLSWVLLSGSGAGNLYLFWSYLDVRHKYRGVVHNARSSGSRYSRLE